MEVDCELSIGTSLPENVFVILTFEPVTLKT